jgi:hypothetical protein
MYDLSTAEHEYNTFTLTAHSLPNGTINAMEYISNLVDKFPNLSDAWNNKTETIIAAAKAAAGGTFDIIEEFFKGEDLIGDNAKSVFNLLLEGTKEADNGVFAGDPVMSWNFNIPNSLMDTLNHDYTTDQYSIEEMMLRKAPAYMALKALTPGIAGYVEKMTSYTFEMSKRAGSTVDPNIITIFNNTHMREFNLTINIIPTSNVYSTKLLQGLLLLKTFMTGRKDSSALYLKQEHCFKLKFNNPKLNDLLYINDNVELNLVSLNITYGADGSMQFVNEGSSNAVPKHIQLSLILQERRPLRRKSEKEYGVPLVVPLSNNQPESGPQHYSEDVATKSSTKIDHDNSKNAVERVFGTTAQRDSLIQQNSGIPSHGAVVKYYNTEADRKAGIEAGKKNTAINTQIQIK